MHIVKRYLADDDPFLVKRRHPFNLLSGNVNKYRQVVRGDQVTTGHGSRTTGNLAAARQFIERGQGR